MDPAALIAELQRLRIEHKDISDAVVALELGNAAMDPSIESHVYLGTPTGAIDSWLAYAWSAQGKTYADALPNIANGVLKIPNTVTGSILDLAIIWRGLKAPLPGQPDPKA